MIKIIAVGKIKDPNLTKLIDDYLKKISSYQKICVIEIKDEPLIKNLDEKIKNIEGLRILNQINENDYVICLDLKGKSLSSEQFANKIEELTNQSKHIVFVIGGSIGLADDVIKRANLNLKISDFTFLHNMVRLIILEQIYRSYKIIRNETYHK